MDDFNEYEFQDMRRAKCPNCGEEVPDVGNGGDPANWWRSENIPDCDLKHKCHQCDQEFRIKVEWSPSFTVIPVEHDHDYENDHSALEDA